MTLSQNWVGYLDRSYEQIKRSCLQRLGILAPEISDHSESNPLIIILSMFAGIGEMLNLYIDSAAREVFLGTARRYSSAVKLTRLIDYNIRARNPSTVNLLFSLVDSLGNPVALSSGSIVIPIGTQINSLNGSVPFRLDRDTRITTGNQNVYASASQFSQIFADILGTTNSTNNQTLGLPDQYVDGSIKVTINGESWIEYRSFGTMFPDTKGFIINIDENSNAFLEFGDGINGMVPSLGYTVFADYKITEGLTGNIPPNQINQLISNIPGLPTDVFLQVTNLDYSSGGSNFENLSDIKNRAPRSIRTLERAVTYQDYKDLCYLVLGVGAAEVSYCCGKYIDIYIAPNSPGGATQALLQSVTDYLDCRKMITTQVDVKAAGISKIWIKATIVGKPLISSADIYNQVVNQLDLVYGYNNLKINRRVAITAIIATIENLSNVDNVELEEVKILPFPRPIMNTINPLNIQFLVLPTSPSSFKYTILWNDSLNKFIIFKGTSNVGQYSQGATYTDDVLSFVLQYGTYINNDKWEFTTFASYPAIFPSTIMEINDYSASIIEVGPLVDINTPRTIFSDLTITTQGNLSNCLAPC